MNGVDYSKNLKRDQEYFRDTIQKTKESADKQVSENENRHVNAQEKQKAGFVNDKTQMEKSHAKSLENIQERTKSSLDNQQDRYHKDVKEQRIGFEKDSFEKRKEFDKRLEDIKGSYQKAFTSEQEGHDELRKSDNTKYVRNLKEFKGDTEKKLSGYQEKLVDTTAKAKEQGDVDRTKLRSSHEETLASKIKEDAQKNAKTKVATQEHLKKVNESFKAEKNNLEKNSTDRLSQLQQSSDNRALRMNEEFNNRTSQLADKDKQNAHKTGRNQSEQVANLERGFNEYIRENELEKRRQSTGSGEFAEVMQSQKGIGEKAKLENQVNSLKSTIDKQNVTFGDKSNDDHREFRKTLKIENSEAVAKREGVEKDLIADKIKTVSYEREKALKQVNNQELLNKTEREAYEQKIMTDKTAGDARMNNLKESFNKSMTSLEEKLHLSLEDVSAVANKDKADFVRITNERRAKEMFDLKRDFNQKLDKTVQSYEQRINTLSRENSNLKMNLDSKVQMLVEDSEKQLADTNKLNQERRTAEKKDAQMAMDQREHRMKTEMNSLITTFQKKLDQMQNENETRLKLLTNDYENKLKNLKVTSAKESGEKEALRIAELQRLKIAYEADKTRMVGGYEEQILSLKAQHADNMAQLKTYNKLT